MKNSLRKVATVPKQVAGLCLVSACTLLPPSYGENGPEATSADSNASGNPPVVETQPQPQSAAAKPENEEVDLQTPPARHPAPGKVDIPPISTSCPSFTDAWTTVPQGSLQAENGVTYTDYSGGLSSVNLPETLLRLGLTDNTEFRFTTPNYFFLRSNQSGIQINNFSDMSVGISHHVALPKKIDMALIPLLNLPTGADNASSNSLDPQIRVSVGKALTSKWTIGGHMDVRWNTGQAATAKVVMNPTFINYYYLFRKVCAFLEYSGFYPTTGKTVQFVQTGVLFAPTPRQQFDARIAVGLNKVSPDILVGVGYSFRLDGLFGKSRAFSSFK